MNLDGMELLVRSEVDACERAAPGSKPVNTSKPSAAANGDTAKTTAKTSTQDQDDLLAEKLGGLLSSSGGGKSKVGRRVRFDFNHPIKPRCTFTPTPGVRRQSPVHKYSPQTSE